MDVEPCVYFVEAVGTNKIKIGITTNMSSRFAALKSSSPCELNLVYAFPGYSSKEKEIHKKFEHLCVKDEWFEYTDEIKQYILELSSTIDTVDIEKIEIKKRDTKLNYDKAISFRITSTTRMMLEEISRDEKLKITELVREAVKEYIISKIGA